MFVGAPRPADFSICSPRAWGPQPRPALRLTEQPSEGLRLHTAVKTPVHEPAVVGNGLDLGGAPGDATGRDAKTRNRLPRKERSYVQTDLRHRRRGTGRGVPGCGGLRPAGRGAAVRDDQ